MKILVYGINFAPELTGIGKYTGEMVAWLTKNGHEVRVVAAPPYYPQWQVGAGHANAFGTEQLLGAQVWRCPLWVPAKPGGTARVLHLLSFAITSLPVMLRQVFWQPDLVWVAAPAFACTPGAWLTAKLSGARSWLHVQDFEVDVAFELGMLRGNKRRHVVSAIERWLLRRFSVVSSISQRMVQRALEKGVSLDRVAFFPNWVDIDKLAGGTPAGAQALRQQLGLPPNALVALFSGTLGAKQGLRCLPELAQRLAAEGSPVHIVVGGEGVMKPMLAEAAQSLPNLHLLPLLPAHQFAHLLAMADMHLLTQDPGVADLVMPSKLAAMLASGRPVVATVQPGTEVARAVANAGLVVPPGDVAALHAAVVQLAADLPLRQRLGEGGRVFAHAELAGPMVLGRFEQQCQALVKNRHLPQGAATAPSSSPLSAVASQTTAKS